MKTQISRDIFDALKRYSGVYQQMGRMLTDSDWNELSEIFRHRLNDALLDVVGSGTPRGRGLMTIVDNPDGTRTCSLKWGTATVDGIPAQVRPHPEAVLSDPAGLDLEPEHQADFPAFPALPGGDHTLYLDVWERAVTALEDPDLLDPGLQGADTCTRTQTMAQVKWCPTTIDPEDPAQNPPVGEARLTLQLRVASSAPDPCDPCAHEIALHDKVGNILFRVEIHEVEYDAAGMPSRVVLKWSSENGAEQAGIGSEPVGFISSSFAYEFFSGEAEDFASEQHLGRHHATGFAPTTGTLTKTYPDTVPGGFSLVRRWDGFCELEKDGTDWTLAPGGVDRGRDLTTGSAADAHGHVEEGPAVTINLDSLTLEIELDSLQALAGDFWQVPVRQAVHVQGDVLMDQQLPAGIVHHYMTLGTVAGGVLSAYDGPRCKRFEFPPLTDIQARDVCYDSQDCDLTDARTVQDALDALCRERDLRWHNKHLHGWGIVCGLVAECGPDTDVDEKDEDENPPRRRVRITPGYALRCDGVDIVVGDDTLGEDNVIDLISLIKQLEEGSTTILKDGNGTVVLRLDLDAEGSPIVLVEPYDAARHRKAMFEGTLLMDFVQDCIFGLIQAVLGEFQFMSASELEAVEGGRTGLVSNQRRKFTSFLNLIIQLINSNNGAYVFLSHKEHLILRDIYLSLRELLQSRTFCALFEGEDFPEYPFPDTGMTTWFGKNNHTRARLNPKGDRLYTYGGTDNTINIHDVKEGELIQVLEMPSAEGAEVSALTFSPDGEVLYAAATVRAVDTVFGMARIADNHHWQKMTILCDMEITELQSSLDDKGLIYAVASRKGLYFLRPELLMDETKPSPKPKYAFRASGHMTIDEKTMKGYCTCQEKITGEAGVYDAVAVCELRPDTGAESLAPSQVLVLVGPQGSQLSGDDGLAVTPAGAVDGPGFLYTVVQGPSSDKLLLTYRLNEAGFVGQLANSVSIERTQVSLAFHARIRSLLLAFEDGYRLQMFLPHGIPDKSFRIPVQIQPMDLVIDQEIGQVYALNFLSNTVSVIPEKELAVTDSFLQDLSYYRHEVLAAFYGLAGGLLQYVKDCFCHHLLVQCPTCGEDDRIYLARVEIVDSKVHQICNFDLRKYVKTFPTMGYWFSLIPIWPVLKWLVSKFCCAILPDFFSRNEAALVKPTPVGVGHSSMTHKNTFEAKSMRSGMQTYQRTDFKGLWREQRKSFSFTGKVMGQSALNVAETARGGDAGIRKQALMETPVSEAMIELQKNRIEVAAVEEYDARKAGTYLTDFVSTPQRIEPGSKVTLVQKDGKVMFYAVEKPAAGAVVTEIPESLRTELAEMERRKTQLADLTALDAELARVEKQRENLVALDEVKAELTLLQTQKSGVEVELAALRSQVGSLRTEREAEAQRLAEVSASQAAIAADLSRLTQELKAVDAMRAEIGREIARIRPVREVPGVNADVDVILRDMGIRTVEELSRTSVETLTAGRRINAATAETLIRAAQRQLAVNR
ncbi:MAG: DUF6519 domain-containing protein [Syntrophobacteraceae bacterium]|nr:DUF6519 domain-containing protein [Syntrophobacteraceae bacterium]